MEWAYRGFYRLASSIQHVGIRAILQDNVPPSLCWVELALNMAHCAALNALHDYNEIAGHGMDERLNRASEAFVKVWKPQLKTPRTPENASRRDPRARPIRGA